MSTEAIGVGAAAPAHDPVAGAASVAAAQESLSTDKKQPEPSFLHSPPDSNNAAKSDGSDSELSDLDEEPILDDATLFAQGAHAFQAEKSEAPGKGTAEKQDAPPQPGQQPEEEDDIGEVLPDHWSGKVAVFKPTMHQFKDFKKFMDKVNPYGMKSGIVKIIPPEEWKSQQPPLDEMIKTLRVREPIKQDIMGSNGTYRQVNILHGRSYNVPQWRQLCEQSEHQPPARRGERRANAAKPKPKPAAPKPADADTPAPKKQARGKPAKKGRGGRRSVKEEERPMTPVSPKPEASDDKDDVVASVELGEEVDPDEPSAPGRMGAVKGSKSKTQSVSARRKYQRREGSAVIDEAAFKDFDYRMDLTDYTPERCEELERAYWKTLTYAAPLYGADMMGTLFDDRTETWNLNKLPNLLDVLGTKIPGVNTAYLYFGMWKATFAWHLEDVDLYSINYVHFGAPKQWYSISQADARRFEAAMKNIWPADAKACSQFLRHKGFLISPQHLLNHYNIQVNKVVSYPGEFVVTFPYGYHSGYNLGYNCAEAVNFALEPWLEMGKIAKRCECAQAQDSVWINVYEIERKLRGEETEYEETDEEEDEDESEDDESGLPTPPNSHRVKIKLPSKKRKRAPGEAGKPRVKRIKLRLKTKAEPPCCLCPNDHPALELLPTDDGRKVHRMCALYLPETYIDAEDDKEVVFNVNRIHKDRAGLKCLYCRQKRGACFQCSQGKCARSYHATCAAAAGVFVEEQEVPIFDENKVEWKEQAFEFSCRFHRSKRDKKLEGHVLEEDQRILSTAQGLKSGNVCQFQYWKGDIFAGIVVENRTDEQTLLVDVLPGCDRLEVEWKWLLLADPSDYHLPKASANAIPMPTSRSAKDKINGKRVDEDHPRKDDSFTAGCTWAEFNYHELERNKDQVKVDLDKPDQLWHYIGGKGSTDTKAQYTEDPKKRRVNVKANFLDTVPKPIKPAKISKPKPPASRPAHFQSYANPTSHHSPATFNRFEKPYVYKPKQPLIPTNAPAYTAQRFALTPQQQAQPQYQNSNYYYASNQAYSQNQTQNDSHSSQTFELKPPQPTYQPMHYTRPTGPTPQATSGFWSYPPQPSQQGYGQTSSPQENHGQYQPPQQHSFAHNPEVQQIQHNPVPAAPNQSYQQSPGADPNYTQNHNSQSQSSQPQGSLHAYSEGLRPPSTQAQCYSHTPAQGSVDVQTPPAPQRGGSHAPMTRPTSSTATKSSTPIRKPSANKLPSWTVTPKVYQDYAFYQAHHNRDSSKYRTPYAPQGGFVNGFEGDLKAHLTANPAALMQTPNHEVPPRPAPLRHTNSQGNAQLKNVTAASATFTQTLPPFSPVPGRKPATPKKGSQKAGQRKSEPAVKVEDSRQGSAHQPVAPQQPGFALKPAVKALVQAPPKESPVPLPANFLAAMGPSGPSTSAPVPPPSKTAKKTASQRKSITSMSPGTPAATPAAPTLQASPSANGVNTPSATSTAPAPNGKISTTPVPLPSFPGMTPHQAAAQAVKQTPISIPPVSAREASTPGTLSPTTATSVSEPTPAPEVPVAAKVAVAPEGPDVTMLDAMVGSVGTQDFPDVPGSESMEFMEKMMANLRKLSSN